MAAADCGFAQTSAPSPKTSVGGLSRRATIQYVNKQFGFTFTLPADWRGYTIVMGEWSGDGDMAAVKGPVLSIQHPRWTEKNPWQDIPIMIFTHPQWSLMEDGRLTVSAAPYTPGEIGRNRTYVFAFPPRFNFDRDEGYEEVIEIMKGHPLHAF
jgi:hypothetical protein